MPGIMFQDVVSPRARSNRKWYTLPLSFLVHTVVLAVLIVVPLIATDTLPRPRALLQFVTPFVPVVPSPPPIRVLRHRRPRTAQAGAPVVAPADDRRRIGRDLRTGRRRHRRHRKHRGRTSTWASSLSMRLLPLRLRRPAPIVVGGNIKPPTRTRYVPPQYPDIARSARVEGVVIIEAIIGTDGKVEQARVLRSKPLLDEAALAAVRAWEYTPTLLNGRPTPVIMTVTVQFSLR